MFEIDTTVGAVGVLALSAAALVSIQRVRQARARAATEDRRVEPVLFAPGLPDGLSLDVRPVEVVPAQRYEDAAPLLLTTLAEPPPSVRMPPPATPPTAESRATVRVRRVVPAGQARTPRPAAPTPARPQAEDLLALIGTTQWDRALDLVHRQGAGELGPVARQAEEATLERLRALPETEARAALPGYRLLAALRPDHEPYAARVAQIEGALNGRRTSLLDRLTRDEDRWEPGTVWYNHPYNPAFDDVRLPIWLYVGHRKEGQATLRMRTNWLGETRISVQGVDAIHERITESLTDGRYKIDADALGWEWRDEAVSPYQLEVLRSLAAAETVTLRYKGDPYAVEVELSPEEIRAVAEMLELYDLLRSPAGRSQAVLAA